ncbi:lipase [Vibrio lentus]|uniref:alpha/beta fold hydrolase n=1 Tax=Vibrio lentus TaxID=136468 RepID=UPI000C820D48|nr:alpha/beta fold hydrolase [Vibrio lentus]PMH32649.1 lipase [Vibrio lentus]PMK70838.1 lipase [Vibrio lentus]
MTTPVKCESYEGEILKEFNKPYLCGLITLALLGCQSEDSTQEAVSVLVPYNINELPKPNDGYGYDDDGTITGVGEAQALLSDQALPYYQDYNNTYAALDGWGVCAEPILIPIESIDSDKRFPLDNNTLTGNVALIDQNGTEVITQISADGANIKIQCESGLAPDSTYYVIVTDGVKTEFGESLQADSEFVNLVSSGAAFVSDKNIELQEQVLNAINLYSGQGAPVYAAQFTTQSTYSTLDWMRDNHDQSVSFFVKDSEKKKHNFSSDYDQYTKTLELPSYLPFTEEREVECIINVFNPKEFCPPLYEWIQTPSQGFPTRQSLISEGLETVEELSLTADIYTPEGHDLKSKLPIVIFVHGVTADKSAASLMASDYTKAGYAVVAIDMPYHGERIRHDALQDESEEGNISAKKNKANFINIDSPLALRSNLQQTVSDFLGLRFALIGQPWVDENNIHLVGHSLGGIMSVMISEFSQNDSNFALKTVNFAVPGQGLTNLVLSSQTLGPEMSDGVKNSPDVQRSIAEALIPEICTPETSNVECITALDEFIGMSSDNGLMVEEFANDVYALIETDLKQGVQTAIDSADPASFTSRQTQRKQPTLLLEAVGNCGDTCEVGDYIPDSVVPNFAANNIRTGTDPLIKALRLNSIIDTGSIVESRGVLRTTTGGHGTYLFPYEGTMGENGLPSIPEGEEWIEVMDATKTHQKAIFSVVESDGSDIEIKNPDHIETEVPQDEE